MKACWILIVLVGACSKSSTDKKSAQGSAAPPAVAPGPPPAKPAERDDTVQQMLAKGTACQSSESGLPLDCPEYKAIGDYAFQHQGSDAVAETCASFLGDADLKKRLLAAKCLEQLNAATATTQLGAALDAIEKETDETVRREIAWGIKHAEAVTAKLDGRVLGVINKLAADPKTERAAGHLFSTLFPQYMMGEGPKPPPAAQTLALDALTRDCTEMQRAAFNAVRLLDDKAAACAALGKAIRADAKCWADAAEALGDLGQPCVADVPRVIELALDRLKAGDAQMRVLVKLDRRFELDAATRKKVATGLKASRGKAREWERKNVDETAARFSKPREAPP